MVQQGSLEHLNLDVMHMVLLNLFRYKKSPNAYSFMVSCKRTFQSIEKDIKNDFQYLIVANCIQLCPIKDLGHLGNPDVISHHGLMSRTSRCSLVLGQS